MKSLSRGFVALSATLLVVLAACGSDGRGGPAAVSGGKTGTLTSTLAERVVSLSPTATEILFAIGAGNQVVAVDDQSNYPTDVPMTDLSGYTPNVEAIASYAPDLVVVSYDPGDLVAGLKALGVATLVQPAAQTISDTYVQVLQLGESTGHLAEAAEINDRIADGLAEIAASRVGQGLTYYHEVDNTLYTTTSSTFLGQLYELLGLSNIADPADEVGFGWPQLSAEFIVNADPDLVFLGDASWGESAETVAARPGWGGMTAVRTGGVIQVDTDMSGRWGPRVVEFLVEIREAIVQLTG
ncbi:MAG: ABC transporter substrate-binding protein [Actinomycetota bacterium]|nr:ABC transporter substrate-binding protein [Actinomycetota bacterium]